MKFPWIGKSEDGQTITIKKLSPEMFSVASYYTPEWLVQNPDKYSIGAAIDIETTGLYYDTDTIIEIGIRIFVYNHITGEVIYIASDCYNGLQDPGVALSEDVKNITGISDDMLKGQSIDWNIVENLLAKCQIIIAHNASFDRPFIDRLSTVSKTKIWGCSLNQIAWNSFGFPARKLDVLSIYHGFFTDAHRALNDADALIYLLSLKNHKTQTSYLFELLINAQKPTMRINALHTQFEKKDLLKSRKYRWDPQNRFWFTEVSSDQYQSEITWLEENVYIGKRFLGASLEISAIDNFKKTNHTIS